MPISCSKKYYQTRGSLRRCSKLLLYNRLEYKSYSIIINKCSRVDGDSFTWNSATVDRLKYTRQPIPFNEFLQLKMPFLHFMPSAESCMFISFIKSAELSYPLDFLFIRCIHHYMELTVRKLKPLIIICFFTEKEK